MIVSNLHAIKNPLMHRSGDKVRGWLRQLRCAVDCARAMTHTRFSSDA